MAYGSMMPGLAGTQAMPMGNRMPQLQPMQIPQMAGDDNAAIGMKILQSALQRQGQAGGQPGGQPTQEPAGVETGAPAPTGGAPMSLTPPAAGGGMGGMGMLSSLLNRMTAMGAPLQNQGGAGPAPSALTGLW